MTITYYGCVVRNDVICNGVTYYAEVWYGTTLCSYGYR